MRLIIPMAGEGKRLRPHTFTVPKPLFPLLGKPVLQWLIEEVQGAMPEPIEEMVFIIRALPEGAKQFLELLAQRYGAKAVFCTQAEPLGTAHAIYQAKPHLHGPCIILFADTIFKASISIPPAADGALWVKVVEDPRSYGVVQLSPEGWIEKLVEKPEVPPSNLAIIGVYMLREAEKLVPAIEYLFEHRITSKGEYQLTDALQILCSQGLKLAALPVEEWLDCGSKALVLQAQARLLELGLGSIPKLPSTVQIVPPVYISPEAHISESVIGPYVGVEAGARIHRSVLSQALCRKDAYIENVVLHDAIIGEAAVCKGHPLRLDLGDYSKYGA